MGYLKPRTKLETHEVINQPLPFENVNLYETDAALSEAVERSGAAWAAGQLGALGERVGSAEVQSWAAEANRDPPRLKSFDQFGQRIDEVEFHPAYHELMTLGISSGVCSVAWTADAGGHAAHTAMLYLLTLADQGVCCPFSMTYASIAALRHEPALAAEWEPRALTASYDRRCRPAAEKSGVTLGMAMTEKQGGSDVRANTTRARRLGGGEFELVGHKWFCSAPMCDGFLTLANTDAGLGCFFVPRWRDDGTRNAIHIVRLKDKLGDRSNASSEIEYHGARARLVGEEGHGVRTIIDMVQGTRLDCMAGSSALMRAALVRAVWYCSQRSAFGKLLTGHPAMAQVLADLALEQEACLALSFRVAQAFDAAGSSEHAAALARVLTPIAKYWICKRTPGFVCEAMECLGGSGYVEESSLPRLFRQSPLNSIWEGSGNIMALDTLRAIGRDPTVLEALFRELDSVSGSDRNLDALLSRLKKKAAAGDFREASARHFVECLALAAQAATLIPVAPSFVADGFLQTRFAPERGSTYGALARELNAAALIERALPIVER